MNPNQVNNFFGVKVSKPGIPVNSASDKQLIYKDDYSTKTWFDSGGVEVLQEGLQPNGTYGLSSSDGTNIRMLAGQNNNYGLGFYVSAVGHDATTATADNLVFNSNQDMFKIVTSGTSTLPSISISSSSSAFTGITIPHNLGFVPIAQVYANLLIEIVSGVLTPVNSYTQLPVGTVPAGTFYTYLSSGTIGTGGFYIYYAVDSTNLYVTGFYTAGAGGGTSVSVPLKYYLLQETAS